MCLATRPPPLVPPSPVFAPSWYIDTHMGFLVRPAYFYEGTSKGLEGLQNALLCFLTSFCINTTCRVHLPHALFV